MKRVTVIGDGGWGTALALIARRNGHAVTVWGPFPEYLREIAERGENARYLPGIPLPPDIRWEPDRDAAVRTADAVFLAVPSQFFAGVVRAFAGAIPAAATVVSVTKGLDRDTHRRMTEVAGALLGREDLCALSGPSFAEEVARGLPTAVVSASRNPAAAEAAQRLLRGPVFRVYTTDDVVGVELGGALKNVIALAAGISDGLGFGNNTKAALATRGLAEMARLGRALGARAETFAGLSGMGDLMLTCTGRLSRNRAVGERIGRGEPLPAILSGMRQVAEGVINCANARALAADAGVTMPIADAVHAILHEGRPPLDAVRELMGRDPRPERD